MIVHRTEEINELAASDSRKALRQALGTLAEDPGQLEVLLRLTEKVIFDEPAAPTHSNVPVDASEEGDETAGSNEGPTTLAVQARGRRGAARRRLVRGDLGHLIDLLIRSLEEGRTTLPAEDEERGQPAEDEDDASAGSLQREAERSRGVDERFRLAQLCASKTSRLVRRLSKRIDESTEDSEGRDRLLAQCAAVLNVLRVVRGLELRTEWRQLGVDLVELQALAGAFECIIASAVTKGGALFGVFGKPGAPLADEMLQILGLLVWLAYEAEVDGSTEIDGAARFVLTFDSDEEIDEHRWYWVHLLACVAPWYVSSQPAIDIAESAIRSGGSADGGRWLATHTRLLSLVARLGTDGTGTSTSDAVSVGDLAILGATFEPRVRVVQAVTPTPRGPNIEVIDFGVEKRVRVFQRSAVPCFRRSNVKATK